MQSQESTNRAASVIGHPEAGEWMAFLYGELPNERQQELDRHVSECAACAEQVTVWRASMAALDEWKLPALNRPVTRRAAAFKWAAAAALVLALGFVAGRHLSPGAAELTRLQESVAQLRQSIQQERASVLSNAVASATVAASTESLRLLTEYSELQERARSSDRRALALTLQNLETRVSQLRAELETVAVNTEDGFEQTHQNMSRLASFSMPTRTQ